MLEKQHPLSLPSPPHSKDPEAFFSLLVFKWKTCVQKHVSRCNVSEASYGDAFSGHSRRMRMSVPRLPPQPEAPPEGKRKHKPAWVLWASELLSPDHQGHAGLDMESFCDSHKHRAESFLSFLPITSSVIYKPNEFLCDPVV